MLSHFKLPFTPDWHCSNARAVPARRPQRYGDLDQQAEAMGGGSDSFSLSTPQTWHRVTPPGWLIYLCSCLSVQLSAGPRSHEPFIHQLLLSTSDIIGGGGRKVLFALTFMNGIISVRFLLDLDLETSESVSDCVNEWNQKQQKSSN